MLIEGKLGKSSLAKDRLALVKCETCLETRWVQWMSNYKKPLHPCKSCSTIKHNTGTRRTLAQRKRMGTSQRTKGWRLQSGYKQVYVEGYHPRKHTPDQNNKGNYVLEHLLVMEGKIGRPVKESELVHHIDGDKLNNSPENLYLFTGSTHGDARRLHNAAHQSAENLTIELLRRGLVVFKEGRYTMTPELSELAATIL